MPAAPAPPQMDDRTPTREEKQRTEPGDEVPPFRPLERFWPYVELPQQPTDEELAALDPDLREVLYGPEQRWFSFTIVFPRFEADDYGRAVELARGASDYRETGVDESFRHRARFRPGEVLLMRDLWQIVGRLDQAEVLVDERPVPYARELWLPLAWFLIR